MMKLILAAALAFAPATHAPQPVATPEPVAPATSAISQYVLYGTTCSAPTPYGPMPMCVLIAPLPLGVSCFCTGNARFGFVTP